MTAKIKNAMEMTGEEYAAAKWAMIRDPVPETMSVAERADLDAMRSELREKLPPVDVMDMTREQYEQAVRNAIRASRTR